MPLVLSFVTDSNFRSTSSKNKQTTRATSPRLFCIIQCCCCCCYCTISIRVHIFSHTLLFYPLTLSPLLSINISSLHVHHHLLLSSSHSYIIFPIPINKSKFFPEIKIRIIMFLSTRHYIIYLIHARTVIIFYIIFFFFFYT